MATKKAKKVYAVVITDAQGNKALAVSEKAGKANLSAVAAAADSSIGRTTKWAEAWSGIDLRKADPKVVTKWADKVQEHLGEAFIASEKSKMVKCWKYPEAVEAASMVLDAAPSDKMIESKGKVDLKVRKRDALYWVAITASKQRIDDEIKAKGDKADTDKAALIPKSKYNDLWFTGSGAGEGVKVSDVKADPGKYLPLWLAHTLPTEKFDNVQDVLDAAALVTVTETAEKKVKRTKAELEKVTAKSDEAKSLLEQFRNKKVNQTAFLSGMAALEDKYAEPAN